MMKTVSLAVLSGLVAGVLAQENNQSSSLIPTGISSTCTEFLTTFNQADDLNTCFTKTVEASAAFNPTTDSNPTAEQLASTLAELCDAGCDPTAIRTRLAAFYTACQSDLVGATANSQVKTLYDILYIYPALSKAVCAKNESTGSYCVQEIKLVDSTTNTGKSLDGGSLGGIPVEEDTVEVAKSAWTYSAEFADGVYRRQETTDQNPLSLLPTPEEYRSTNLVYLFINKDLEPTVLCTPCTKSVLTSYIEWETSTPYAMGLDNSPILGGQSELWNGVKSKCGDAFAQEILTTAGVQNTETPINVSEEGGGAFKLTVGSALFSLFGAASMAVFAL